MNLIAEAIAWLFSPERLVGANAVQVRMLEHLGYTVVSVAIAALIAIPIGYYIGHTGRGREFVVGLSGAARALPSFGLILLLVLLVGVRARPTAVVIALVLLAIPSILAGAYAGLGAIDRRIIDSARAVGMTEWQILRKVEVPLGFPLLVGGLRNAILQVVATATLAGYVGIGGLGYYIFKGLPLGRYDIMLGGALLVVALALLTDAVFALVQHYLVPGGEPAGRTTVTRRLPTRRRAVMGTPIEEGKG